jgi:hypothetical protein
MEWVKYPLKKMWWILNPHNPDPYIFTEVGQLMGIFMKSNLVRWLSGQITIAIISPLLQNHRNCTSSSILSMETINGSKINATVSQPWD